MFNKLLSMDFQGLQHMVCVTVPPMLMYSIVSSAVLHEEIQTAIPSIVKCLEDSDLDVQHAALNGLSRLTTHGMSHCSFNADILNCVFSKVV